MNTILHFTKKTFFVFFLSITSFSFSQTGCWKKISGTVTHTLAIKNDGTLWAWGLNDSGQLGDGTLIDKDAPIQIGLDNNWKEISTGQSHSLAIKNNGTLWAWGDNFQGELGNNSNTNSSVPIQITTNTNWKSISAGSFYSTALKNDGTLWSWGSNEVGQLGLGNLSDKLIPTQVGVSAFWKSISAGSSHTIALKTDNTIWGFGKNTLGSLGLGNNNNFYLTPTQIGINNDWKKISVSKDYWGYPFSVGIKNDGTMWSTGNNPNGQIGNGSNSNNVYTFSQIGTQNDWADIEAGASHSVALKNSGNIYSWGSNSVGQIGDGTNSDKFSPTLISTIQSIQKISCGLNNSFIINSSGSYYAFGSNVYGNLGNGSTTNSNTPITISCPISTITNVSYTPTLFLSSSSTQLGQSITITGNNYTPNGEVQLNFYGAGGLYRITANADGFGNVTHLYTNPSGAITGQVAVKVYDKTTTKYSPTKTFNLTSTVSGAFNLAVTSPNNGYKIPVAQLANITWRDKMILSYNGITYPIQSGTAKRQYDYSIEYRENSSSPWLPINGTSQVTGYATLNENMNFQTTATFSTTSTNYTIRVKDNLNNAIIAQSAIFEVTPTASVSLEWDKSMNANPSHKPIGVVADGVSRIYIKVTPTTGTLSSVDVTLNNSSDTTVNLLGKVMPATEITNFSNEADNATLTTISNSTIVGNSAWIWYVAPEDFKGSNLTDLQTNKRTVNANIVIHKTDGSTENVAIPIIIKRPQILFAHGLMGDEHTFDNFKLNGVTPFENLFYESTKVRMMPGASFVNNAKALLGLRAGSSHTFQWFLNEDRKNGFASCQVDFVGHSMGGCIARSSEMQPEFRHPRFTYGKGYIHKLITLGTPHNSSPIADLIIKGIEKFNDAIAGNSTFSNIAAAGSLFDFGKLYQDDPNNKWFSIVRPRVNTDPNIATNISNWLNIMGINNPPLINYDLSPSQAISNLAINGGVNFPLTPLKTHFIVGDLYPGYQALPTLPSFDEALIEQLSMIQDMVDKMGWVFDLIETCNTEPQVKADLDQIQAQYTDPVLRGMARAMKIIDFYNKAVVVWNASSFALDSDGVVDIFSQSAGLPLTPGNSVTVFDYTAHTGAPNNVTARPTVVDKVIDLLNTNRTSGNFSAIPGNTSSNRMASTNTNTFLDNLDFSKLQIEVDPTKMDIITPLNSQFTADNIVTIQIMLTDITNFSEIELHVGKEIYATSTLYNGIATFTFQVTGAVVGALAIYARATYSLPNGNTKFLYDSTEINIVPSSTAVLSDLQINPEVVELWVGDKYKPVVNAIYPNYISVIQATPTIIGNIVSYNANEKELTALNVGETQVIYNYSGFSKILYVIVRNNYDTQCTQSNISISSTNSNNLPCDLSISNATNVSEIIWFKDNIVVSSASTNTIYTPSISGTYYAVITTTDGCTYTTSSIDVGTLGINEYTNELNNIKIYPNPTKDIINVEIDDTKIQFIKILDLSGRIMKTENLEVNKAKINIQDLPNAIYLMQVKTEIGTKTVKVIKK
jgi:alpha-tubulin suppressor-like RCC1 family protein